jgi:hypothetical protein
VFNLRSWTSSPQPLSLRGCLRRSDTFCFAVLRARLRLNGEGLSGKTLRVSKVKNCS